MIRSLLFVIGVGALSFLLFRSGCKGDEAPASFQFVLKDSTQVDESNTVITRKPTTFRVINDSHLISVINARKLVQYNYRTGKIVREFGHQDIPEDSLYQDIASYRQRELKRADLELDFVPSLDSAKKCQKEGQPHFLFYPRILYDREDRMVYLCYKLGTVTIEDRPEKNIFRHGSQFYILQIGNTLSLKRIMAAPKTPNKLKNFNKPFFWPFFGFIAQDSSLITYVNAEGPLKLGGKMLARYTYHPDTGQYLRKEILGPSLDKKRVRDLESRFDIFHHTFFKEHKGEKYWTEGKRIYSLDQQKVAYPDLIKGSTATNKVYNFHWPDGSENFLYYTCMTNDTTKEKGKRFSVRIYDTSRKRIMEKMKVEPYHTKLAFYRNKVVLFTRKDEHYYFKTYEVERTN